MLTHIFIYDTFQKDINLFWKLDLSSSMDDTQTTIFLLQLQITDLQETNTLLLEKISVLETNDEISDQRFAELEMTTNTTNQELQKLEEAFNITSEIVENHDTDIDGSTTVYIYIVSFLFHTRTFTLCMVTMENITEYKHIYFINYLSESFLQIIYLKPNLGINEYILTVH